ncbi:class I SAM-dependent methyltransferase [Hydrogenimonas sp.]
MSERDRTKWNIKYRDRKELLERNEPARFVREYVDLAKGKRAIDLACGGGRNAIFLAKRGFDVDAVDLSSVAIEALERKSAGLPVHPRCLDLDRFDPPGGEYDLALMINFLDRALLRRVAEALRPGGVIVVETYMTHPDNEKRGNPDFLLDPGELRNFFGKGFETVVYEEFWSGEEESCRMRKQGVVVKKGSDG